MFEIRTAPDVRFSSLESSTSMTKSLTADLRKWWKKEQADWDSAVTASDPNSLPGGAELWNNMPVVDSKAAARTSPIFEKHLGIPLDTKLIRPGGYRGIEDMISDLVGKMEAAANVSQKTATEDR